ncbi:MAG: hypothetical protein E7285_08405 [Lachnospiraceae bacterium]|nr:hypothetical protein [Lachnospiraceae bacterium]
MNRNAKTEENKIKERWIKAAEPVFVAVSFIVLASLMLYGMVVKEFWFDEMAILGFISTEDHIVGMLRYYLTVETTNLPLFALIIYPLYHLLPTNEGLLLIPGVMMTLAGVALLYRYAREEYGKIAGCSLLALCMCSTTIINRIGIELRAYCLMFFSVCLILYLERRRERNPEKKGNLWIWIASFLLVFSHYFGVLFFGCVALLHLARVIAKKEKFVILLPYVVNGILFLVWFVLTRLHTIVNENGFWILPPEIKDIFECIGYLLGGSYIYCVLYGICFVAVAVRVCKRREFLSFSALLLYAPVVIIGGIYIYSKYLTTGGGLFEDRYFIALLPCLLLTVARGFAIVFSWLQKQKTALYYGTAVLVVLMMAFSVFLCYKRAFADLNLQVEHYTYSISYMKEEGVLVEEGTPRKDALLLISYYDPLDEAVVRGWYDYYIRKPGLSVSDTLWINHGNLDDVFETCEEKYRNIYVWGDLWHRNFDEDIYQLMEEWEYARFSMFERIAEE